MSASHTSSGAAPGAESRWQTSLLWPPLPAVRVPCPSAQWLCICSAVDLVAVSTTARALMLYSVIDGALVRSIDATALGPLHCDGKLCEAPSGRAVLIVEHHQRRIQVSAKGRRWRPWGDGVGLWAFGNGIAPCADGLGV